MSEPASIAVVGPSYWTFMATVMATRLQRFIQSREVTPGDIPEGVYLGAKEFFDLVLGAAGEGSSYPPASVNAFLIATDVLRGSLRPFPQSSRDLKDKFVKYALFLEELNQAHSLTDEDELETATSLKDFFLSLAQDGEAEQYMQTIQANHTSPGFPFIR